MHRPVAAADRQAIAGGNRLGKVRLGAVDRLGHGEPRQQRSDRSRQRATGAMRIARFDAAAGQFGDRLAIEQQIGAARSCQMPTLEQHPLRAEPVQFMDRPPHVGERRRRGSTEQYTGLGKIRCDHTCHRDEHRAQCRNRIFPQQMMAALRHHHRIQHDVAHPMMPQTLCDRRGNLRCRHHADLNRIDPHVGEYRVDLFGDESRVDGLKGSHTLRVLRRQRGDNRHAIGTERGECLQVGLDAGAAAWIRAGDGKDIGNHAATAGAASFKRGNTSVPNSRMLFSASWCVRNPDRPMKIRWPKPPSSP